MHWPAHVIKSSLCVISPPWSLTHWGRVMHICVGKLTIIGSDNGLSPGRHQAITWTNAGIFLIRPLATNFSEILIGYRTFSFKEMRLKMSSAKWRPFCLGLNVLKRWSCKLFMLNYRLLVCCIHRLPIEWLEEEVNLLFHPNIFWKDIILIVSNTNS